MPNRPLPPSSIDSSKKKFRHDSTEQNFFCRHDIKTMGKVNRRVWVYFQKKALIKKTHILFKQVKDERFEIEEEKNKMAARFYCDDPTVDFPHLVSITTRSKIHIEAHNILLKIRNGASGGSCNRLAKLISIHKNQLKKIGTDNYSANVLFYTKMLDAIATNHHWLQVLNAS